jgi:NADH dehydrogenase
VVWGGGITAPGWRAREALPHGRGGRIDVRHDLSVEGLPGVYAIGDVANIPSPDGQAHPSWAQSRCRAA